MAERELDGGSAAPATPEVQAGLRLNGPMVARLRRCAADVDPNWYGRVTIYPPEARELVALIDHSGVAGEPEATTKGLSDLIKAAFAWRDRIKSHPNNWADDEDFALIEAVDGHRAALRSEAPRIAVAAAPTPVHPDAIPEPAAAVLAGGVVVTDEMVQAFYAAFYRVECTAEVFHVADAY